MDARTDLLATDDLRPGGACAACPLRIAVERIAQVALRQHVLYLEGELQPRVELLRALEESITLERLIRARVCAISRGSALPADELARAVDALDCRELHGAMAACAGASACPLGA